MKVRLVVQMSGTRGNNQNWPPVGAEINVGDDEGRDLCAAGIAVPVAEVRAVETADMPVDPKAEVRAEASVTSALPPRPGNAVPDTPADPPKRGPGRPPKDAG